MAAPRLRTLRPPPLRVVDADVENWAAKSKRKGVVMRLFAGLLLVLAPYAIGANLGWVLLVQALLLGAAMIGMSVLVAEFYESRR